MALDGMRWVRGADQSCETRGCQLQQAAGLLAAARQIIEEGRRENMSAALWCDAGGHAFSERDKGRQRISVAVLDEETDEERQESRDFCGACAEVAGLLQKRRTRPAAITSGDQARARIAEQQSRQAHIDQLESELGIGGGVV